MKNVVFFRSPDVAEATATAAVKAEPTSEKLVALKQAMKEKWSIARQIEDPFSDEAKAANMEVFKLKGEIAAEIAAIIAAENAAKIAEARNARLALNKNQLDLFASLLAVKADKRATAETVAAAQTAFDTAKELVDNELLAKYASSRPAKAAVSSDGATTAKTSANKDAILELARAGKSHKEIEAEGHKRSTVWHTINNAKKAGETFPNA